MNIFLKHIEIWLSLVGVALILAVPGHPTVIFGTRVRARTEGPAGGRTRGQTA